MVAKSGEAENRPIKPSASEFIFLEVDSKLESCWKLPDFMEKLLI
ncbi:MULTISPECIES: hypothetical protein [Okeania]|nr:MULTISPECIES: hypothetical protein [Okeania]